MKAWRRTGRGRAVGDPGLPPGPELVALPGEVVEAGAVGIYLGTHFLLPQISPDGLGGWVDQPEVPISADPQNIDATGHIGEFMRASITIGDAVPITQWSNVVEILG